MANDVALVDSGFLLHKCNDSGPKALVFPAFFASFNKKIASNTPKQTGHLFRRTGASAGTPFCGASSLAKREPSKRIAESWRALLREI
jgi:hypothetical protein